MPFTIDTIDEQVGMPCVYKSFFAVIPSCRQCCMCQSSPSSRPCSGYAGLGILASLRTLDVSGLLLLDSVSENLLIATTSVLMLASLWVISLTSGWISSANAWKLTTFILRLW